MERKNKYSIETRDRFIEIGRNHEMRIEHDADENGKKGQKFGFAYLGGNLSQGPLDVNADFLN